MDDVGADAFDTVTDAAMFTPAAPYAAAAKAARPLMERVVRAAVPPPRRKKPKAKAKPADPCVCPEVNDVEKPKNDDAGFVSVGAVPPKPTKPRRNHMVWSSGQQRYYQANKPQAQYDKEMAAYKVALKAWEEARAFDEKISLEKKRLEEQMRRAKSQNEVTALKKKLEAMQKAQNLSKASARLPGFKTLNAFYKATAQNGVPSNLDANKLLEALNAFAMQLQAQPAPGVDPGAFATPMAPPVSDFMNPWAQPQAPMMPQPYAVPPGYAVPPSYAVPQAYAASPGFAVPPGYALVQTPQGPMLVPAVDPTAPVDPAAMMVQDPDALIAAELLEAQRGRQDHDRLGLGLRRLQGLEQLLDQGDEAGWASDSDDFQGLEQLLDQGDEAGWASDSDEAGWASDSDELQGDEAGWASDFDGPIVEVGRTDSACCTSCALGGPCEAGACGIGGGCRTC